MFRQKLLQRKKIILYTAGGLLALVAVLLVLANQIIQPILKKRLHTLIIQGSDSLYTYTLDALHTSVFTGKVEVENLQIKVDSNRYQYLKRRGQLPALVMELTMRKAMVNGFDIFPLLFSKKLNIGTISTSDADLKLIRNIRKSALTIADEPVPLWKAIQPAIKAINIDKIKLDGIKLLYDNEDTSTALKLQFNRFDARFENVRLDSTAANDTTRIGFSKTIFLQVAGLQFRTADSLYRFKAGTITYTSDRKKISIDSLDFGPTLQKAAFYDTIKMQREIYYAVMPRFELTGINIDQFINNNRIQADSIILHQPKIDVYYNRSLVADYRSKVGRYPHELLMKANAKIQVGNMAWKNAGFTYTEKNGKNLEEGVLTINDLNVTASNLVNDTDLLKRNNICAIKADGKFLKTSPMHVELNLFLGADSGLYNIKGSMQNVTATQLNALAEPLALVKLNSFNVQQVNFNITGKDLDAIGDIDMRYTDLALTLQQLDKETLQTKKNNFLTGLLNRFVVWPQNPGPDGVERKVRGRKVQRLYTQSFFGLIWKTLFAGIQDIIMKAGRVV